MADNHLMAKVLKHHGGKLVDRAVDRLLPPASTASPSFTRKLAGAALLRIAMRSVPGAILVGGGFVAKRLHDRHKARKAARPETPADT